MDTTFFCLKFKEIAAFCGGFYSSLYAQHKTFSAVLGNYKI